MAKLCICSNYILVLPTHCRDNIIESWLLLLLTPPFRGRGQCIILPLAICLWQDFYTLHTFAYCAQMLNDTFPIMHILKNFSCLFWNNLILTQWFIILFHSLNVCVGRDVCKVFLNHLRVSCKNNAPLPPRVFPKNKGILLQTIVHFLNHKICSIIALLDNLPSGFIISYTKFFTT